MSLKLYPSNLQFMLNKDLSRFMPSFGTFTNFKALFSVASTDFPYLVHIKSGKNGEKFYFNCSNYAGFHYRYRCIWYHICIPA